MPRACSCQPSAKGAPPVIFRTFRFFFHLMILSLVLVGVLAFLVARHISPADTTHTVVHDATDALHAVHHLAGAVRGIGHGLRDLHKSRSSA